jgi:hypothetical protein
MSLTASEAAVIERLRHLTVATMATLQDGLGVSHMTVVRALRKHGYFTSFNHNSAFYVLADIPRFDGDGLWQHSDIGFSRQRTLQATVLALVERASAGCTVVELQSRLATPVANLLSRLSAKGLIGRMSLGRCAVYLAADPSAQARQRACRGQLAAPATLPPSPCLPPDLLPTTLIELLVQLLRTPTASPASLSQTLQARGFDITADQVRQVFDFYDLQKKRGRWPSANSSTS